MIALYAPVFQQFTPLLLRPSMVFIIAMQAWLERLKKFADRGWYAPIVGLLAGADQFIVLVPIEMLMIPSVLLNPRRWLRIALWIALGCTLGALALAAVSDLYGMTLIEHWAPNVVHSKNWVRSVGYINNNGAWALFLISLGPFPQQPAVALAGLAHMPLLKVGLAVGLGRSIKYGVVAYLASHAPTVLAKVFPTGDQKP
jgi:membrane protein YqaA with SNARE-associated domain